MSLTKSLISKATLREHKATWWVYAGTDRIRHEAGMRGLWGYDVTCSCGWDSRTGGGLRWYVADLLFDHRHEAEQAKGPSMEPTEASVTQAILEARELAAARGDYYVSTPGATRLFGPLGEPRMRQMVDDLRAEGHKPLVLKVVEDYGR